LRARFAAGHACGGNVSNIGKSSSASEGVLDGIPRFFLANTSRTSRRNRRMGGGGGPDGAAEGFLGKRANSPIQSHTARISA